MLIVTSSIIGFIFTAVAITMIFDGSAETAKQILEGTGAIATPLVGLYVASLWKKRKDYEVSQGSKESLVGLLSKCDVDLARLFHDWMWKYESYMWDNINDYSIDYEMQRNDDERWKKRRAQFYDDTKKLISELHTLHIQLNEVRLKCLIINGIVEINDLFKELLTDVDNLNRLLNTICYCDHPNLSHFGEVIEHAFREYVEEWCERNREFLSNLTSDEKHVSHELLDAIDDINENRYSLSTFRHTLAVTSEKITLIEEAIVKKLC